MAAVIVDESKHEEYNRLWCMNLTWTAQGDLNSANLMVKQAKLFSPGETPSLNDSQQV